MHSSELSLDKKDINFEYIRLFHTWPINKLVFAITQYPHKSRYNVFSGITLTTMLKIISNFPCELSVFTEFHHHFNWLIGEAVC